MDAAGRDPIADRWIVIPNWDKFQHYKNRNPGWIKVYCELNSRDDWLALTDAERGLLVLLWVEFGRSNGRLRSANVPARDRQKSRKRAYETLNQAGFIQFSSSPPSPVTARARTRSREELSKESSKEAASATTKNGRASASREENSRPHICPSCGLAFKTDTRLADHLNVVHWE